WNTFVITVKGDRLNVVLNDHFIIENALLPEVPERGPVALQHHGGKGKDGEWSPASSLVQFRNIFIRELE
ncbi:MAG: family 16 glycoside hydrolase, partial [Verrucomicrobiota bacterium]